MNWIHNGPAAACVIALYAAGTLSLAQSSDSPSVVAHRVIAPKASPKVGTVLWTRRTDRYTLQVVFPRSSAVPSRQQNPAVTLWLLGADGAVISSSKDPVPVKSNTPPAEVSYSVPLSSGEAAVAAALRIDDEYFIEKLQPLN